jgi:isopenicillin N synthase-like dioxygenase
MKRADKEKSTHDRKVRQVARQLKKDGYSVKAASGRYDRPSSIGKYRRIPDIEATTKSGRRIIVEVETPRSLPAHREQIKTFIRHAAHKKRTSFDIVVTKPRKTSR